MIRGLIAVWGLVWSSLAFAACPEPGNLEAGHTIQLTRLDPPIEATFSHNDAEQLVEDRETVRGEAKQRIRSLYAAADLALERRPETGPSLRFDFATPPESLAGAAIGARRFAPFTLRRDGAPLSDGFIETHVVGKNRMKIGPCSYEVLILRESIKLPDTPPLNAERSFAHEIGVVIGSVTMNVRWEPRSVVAFDRIERRAR